MPLLPFRELLQQEMNKKINDILNTYNAYSNAFTRAKTDQKEIPNTFLSLGLFNNIVPNINSLEHLVDNRHSMACGARVANILKEQENPKTVTQPTSIVNANSHSRSSQMNSNLSTVNQAQLILEKSKEKLSLHRK